MKKTRICRHYYLKGWCERGNKCGFAHGPSDLQNSPRVCIKKGKQGIGSVSPYVAKTHISQDYVVVHQNETKDVYAPPGKNNHLAADHG
jgi:hypothetical protein